VLRFLTAGESHGKALVVIVEGLPAGLPVEASDVAAELARRRLGYGRGPRMRFEADEITLLGGIRHGRTLGSPVAIEIANTEWPKWTEEMSPEPGVPGPGKVLTQPRPGHADLPGMLKYGFDDARDVLERASARETAARVAAGTLAKLLLHQLGASIVSHIVALGDAETSPDSQRPGPGDLEKVDESAVRCFDPVAEEAMIAAVKAAAKVGDSLGGVAEVLAYGVPVGLGSHVHWDRKLDANLAQAFMSIQAVKAVEIGEGWDNASRRGSEAHDAILYEESEGYVRPTDRAGGIEGGMSNGSLIVARVAMKPLATLNRPVLQTVDVVTKESTVSFKERTDVTAVPAMGVVAESMMALVLANEALRKFGGDSLAEVVRNQDGYVASLGSTPSSVAGRPSPGAGSSSAAQ
jgi:chorismate synthase